MSCDSDKLTPEFHGPSVGQLIEPVEVPKELTTKQIKELMRQYFSIRRAVVAACGHKLDLQSDPKTNCPYCWFAWFANNSEVVETTDELFTTHGPEGVVAVRGSKYLKQFTKFIATVAAMQKMETEREQSVRGTQSSGDPWESPEYIGGGN